MLFNSIMTLLRGGAVDPLSVIIQILATLVIVFLALPLHELAHGWVAYKLGDPTAKYEGRLTLNPLASIDPMGAMFLLLFGIGWAKPVPIDSRYFKNPRSGVALTSLAGPAANLVMALLTMILAKVALFAGAGGQFGVFRQVAGGRPLPPLTRFEKLSLQHSRVSVQREQAAFHPQERSRLQQVFIPAIRQLHRHQRGRAP